jgi:hypothetical protein
MEVEPRIKQESSINLAVPIPITEKHIRENIGLINSGNTGVTYLPCAIRFFDWTGKQLPCSEKVQHTIPVMSNMDSCESKKQPLCSVFQEPGDFKRLKSFRESISLIDSFEQRPILSFEDENWASTFSTIQKEDLLETLHGLPLKKHPYNLLDLYFSGIIYLEYLKPDSSIGGHFINFYKYQAHEEAQYLVFTDSESKEIYDPKVLLQEIGTYYKRTVYIWHNAQPTPPSWQGIKEENYCFAGKKRKLPKNYEKVSTCSKSQRRSRRKEHEDIIKDNHMPSQQKANAQLELANMDRLGQETLNGKPDYESARNGFNAVLTNVHASSETKANAQLELANMDLLRQGTHNGERNYESARNGYNAVFTNVHASPETKGNAQLGLAITDRLGQGTPKDNTDYESARNGFNAVLTNVYTSLEVKAIAQLELANMDRLGQGTHNGERNYESARNGFNAVLANVHASPENKANAQLVLANMDRLGQGTPKGKTDYESARNGYNAVLTNVYAPPETKAIAQLGLTNMDRLGQGTPKGKTDYESARNGYNAVLTNVYALPETKIMAQLGLANMDRLGQGTLKNRPDYESARNGYNAVLTNVYASPETKAIAQLGLTNMDR